MLLSPAKGLGGPEKISLDHLRTVDIRNFKPSDDWIRVLQVLLANSPALDTMTVELDKTYSKEIQKEGKSVQFEGSKLSKTLIRECSREPWAANALHSYFRLMLIPTRSFHVSLFSLGFPILICHVACLFFLGSLD